LTVVHRLNFWFARKCPQIAEIAIFELFDDWTLSMRFPLYLSQPMCFIGILIIVYQF